MKLTGFLALVAVLAAPAPANESKGHSDELAPPVRLEADGKPIDMGLFSSIAHAGPWIADVDCDGDRDLLVGDFPGYFWFFRNVGTEDQPKYKAEGQLTAGEQPAKTPVY